MTDADRQIVLAVRSLDGALERLTAMLRRVEHWPDERLKALLSSRLAPDMFDFAQQVRIAVNFTLRIALPLAGRPIPEAPAAHDDLADLYHRIDLARAALDLPDEVFVGAAGRRLPERAGFAELDLPAPDFLIRFGLPNFWFHLTSSYALLRAAGAPVGKADIDGLHDYPPGFSF